MQKIKINCFICKRVFESYVSQKKKYCSSSCFHKARVGIKPWNTGMKMSFKERPSIKGKIPSNAWKKGHHASPSTEFKKGLKPWNKGVSPSEETRKKISEAGKGKKKWLGRKHRPESIEKMSESHIGLQVGEKHGRWKGGTYGTERHRLMGQFAYRNWRETVFERDNYTCQTCGARGVTLNADHIKPWALYPDLRFNINNGRTLCVPCHKKTPTWGGGALKCQSQI